jgi:hypothetical protein
VQCCHISLDNEELKWTFKYCLIWNFITVFSYFKLLVGHILDRRYDIHSLPICVECEEQAQTGSGKKSVILNNCFLFFLSFICWLLSFHIFDDLFGIVQTRYFCHLKMSILAAGSMLSFCSVGTGESVFGSKAAGHFHLVLWLRICRAVPPLPLTRLWHV